MRRPPAPPARPGHRIDVTIDLVLWSPHEGGLAVLLRRERHERHERHGSRWVLPQSEFRAGDAPDAVAARLAADALGRRPAWLGQVGAFGDARGPAALTIVYMGVVPASDAETRDGFRWCARGKMPPLLPRHREAVHAASAALRDRLDRAPVAFGLLPPVFTLRELQAIYELLCGRPLHKASFRRTLQTARMVKATDEWRTEGRGRPAQLFRAARAPVRGPLIARRGPVRMGRSARGNPSIR